MVRLQGSGQPGPAQCCRSVQAIAKMVCTPELSLRGRFAPVAISGRHLQSVQAIVKMICTDCVCSGDQCAAVGSCKFPGTLGDCTRHCRGAACRSRHGTSDWYRPTLKWDALPNCHCEGASRPWQSHAPTSEFAEVALLSTRILRDCHVGLRPPRNDTSGEHGAGNGALHRISRPIAASRTGLAVPAPTTCYRYPKFICPQPLRNRPHRPRGARRS